MRPTPPTQLDLPLADSSRTETGPVASAGRECRAKRSRRAAGARLATAVVGLLAIVPTGTHLAEAQPSPRAVVAGSASGSAAKKPPGVAAPVRAAVAALRAAAIAAKPDRAKGEESWIAASTDLWLERLAHRAAADANAARTAAIGEAIAIAQSADDGTAGAARKALTGLAALATDKASNDVAAFASDAATMALALAPELGTTSAHVAEAKLGIVSAWRIAGPFKDSSGTGLDRAEGPELAGPSLVATGAGAKTLSAKPRPLSIELFRDAAAHWADGAYDASWRAVPPQLVSARGVPLEVMIYPRKEACTYLATAVTLTTDSPIVIRVAAAGSVRVMFDGATIAHDDEQHSQALVDRIAARLGAADATKGAHLLALKVCAGPSADSGRVRARITDERGRGIDATFSDDLGTLPSALTPPVSATVVKTWLERSLALGESMGGEPEGASAGAGKSAKVAKAPATKIDADEALGAALARRLGGADDARSPRAQGLLDLAVEASARPDRLALAGYLAPNRGSQTAWLGLAIDVSDGDAVYDEVSKFSRRFVAELRLGAGYSDWAASTIAGSEMKTATDLDALESRARLADALGDREAAFAAYKSIFDARGAGTPTSVLRALSSHAYGRPLIASQAIAQAASVWPRESALALSASKQHLGSDALKAAVIGSFRLVSSTDEVLALAELLHDNGLESERRHLLEMLTEWAPNRKEVFAALTQALAGSTDAKERGLVPALLQRARELDPGSPFLRAEQSVLKGESHLDDEAFIPSKETFLARRKGAPKPGPDGAEPVLDVYDRELNWLRVVTVDDAGRVVTLFHYTREIVKAPKDASDLDEDHIPVEGDSVEVVRARLHRADGTTALPQEINEGDGLRIRWADLKPGDVVEVATRGFSELPIGDRGAAPYYFMDYAGGPATHPVLYNEVVVRSPKKHPLFTSLVHGEVSMPDIHTNTTDASGRSTERYVWNAPISLPEEPLQPRGTEMFPTIIGSQFKSWDDFATWYKAGVEAFSSVDPRVRRKAEEIIKGKKTRDEKVNAIFNWIADQVKYVNYVSAEQWLPNRPQNVLDRMQGDCDDKAMLLMTMLKAIGIDDAEEVLVQTRYTGQPSVITAKGAVAPVFDHGIAFLPGHGGEPDRYLDATSPESRIGPLPSMDARAPAIRMARTGTTPIVTLPSSSPEEHGTDGTWTFVLAADGSSEIDVDESHVGDSAFFLRMSLKQAASAPTWLEKFHDVATLPQVEVLPTIDFKGELPQGRATLKFKAKSAALARREGTDLVVGVRWGQQLAASLARLVTRKTDLVLPPDQAPARHALRGLLTPPVGYHAAELTLGGEVDGGKYGRASLSIEKGPKGTVVVKRTFVLDQSTIPVAEYTSWRDFLLRVDALFQREVRFVKGGV